MDFNKYQQGTLETWIDSNLCFETEIARIVLGICGESGEVAEKVKKYLRGDNNQLNNEDIKKELGDIIYYIAMLCNKLDIEFNDVAQLNYDKLISRKERNQIKGSGDNR